MISSLIWLYLIHIGRIDCDNAPWIIYLPIVLAEMISYLKFMPKIADLIFKDNIEGI